MPIHDPSVPPKLAMPSSTPAPKVVAAAGGAGLGGVVAGLILWALGAYVFANGVPDAVSAAVYVVVPLVLSFVGGYVTPRSAAEVRGTILAYQRAAAPAPVVAEPVLAPVAKKVAAKKAAAKRPAKKAAPKPPSD